MRRAAVILDVDGTLVDSNDAHARAWVDAFAEAGITVSYDEVRRSIGMGGDRLMPKVSGLDEASDAGERISARRGEIFKERYLPHVRGFAGARALVERLRADGFAIAVASSAKEHELGDLLERAGVRDLVTTATSSDDAEESKPAPDIVAAALARVRCEPSCSVMIGDTPYDVEAATRAGVPIVAVTCGGWAAEDLADAIAVYAGPEDLLRRYDESPFPRLLADARREVRRA